MAKRPRPRKPTAPGPQPRSVHKGRARRARPARAARPALLIVLATTSAHLEEAVAVLIDMGIAATVIQTKPLTTVLRDELPVFAGLASLLPKMPESRLLVSITSIELADRALKMLSAEDSASRSGLFVATVALRGFIGSLGKH
jgi:hypothetical protein